MKPASIAVILAWAMVSVGSLQVGRTAHAQGSDDLLDELMNGESTPPAENRPDSSPEKSASAGSPESGASPAQAGQPAQPASAGTPPSGAPPNQAAETQPADPGPESGSSVTTRRPPRVVEEIVVTATKRGLSRVQDVPIAMTAFGSEQLDRMNFHSLQSLSYVMPNVQLEDVGTLNGYANFSIRGQGINSSIPSVDPTVGVFVDGVYMGSSAGLVLDNFDLEGIEVLRGPQGILFGRNVTGGAILLRTKLPGEELEASAHAGVETGLTKIASATIMGPLIKDMLGAKIAMYYSDDPGWFTNLFDDSEHGAAGQRIIRTALRATPLDWVEAIVRAERGEADGDGPSAQNHALWKRGTFDFAINRPGFYDSDWNQVFFEANVKVPFGDGTITNITAWRDYGLTTEADIDATVDDGFYAQALLDQEQLSEELRYAGGFGPVDVTTGVYYFTQDLLYIERRLLGNESVDRTGGGIGDFSTFGVFGAADWSILHNLILNLGLRYTAETKDAKVSTIATSRTESGGDVNAGTLNPNFFDKESWSDITPKIGLQYMPIEGTLVYSFWAKGFRSGGYNFRNTTDSVPPGPFDSEEQNSYEIGFKHDFPWFPVRLNGALFHNEIKRVQRELNVPGSFGVSQTIVNSGNARIRGAELETRVLLPYDLAFTAQGGWLDGKYRKVTTDLNRDGEVNAADKALEIPRLAPMAWGMGLEHEFPLWSVAVLASRVSFSHRDLNYFTDSNQGFLDVWDGLDFNLTLGSPTGRWAFTFFGTNLLNKSSLGGHTPLPDDDPPLFALFGGDGPGPLPTPSFSPLNKGRVIGGQIRINY